MPDPTIEEMAARYVAELRAEHQGPYLLGGYSGGGIVTFEMVRQLQALGEEVRYIVLFDSVPPGRADAVRAAAGAQPARPTSAATGYGPLQPYIKERVKRRVQAVHPASASGASSRSRPTSATSASATSRTSASSTCSTTSAPPPTGTR